MRGAGRYLWLVLVWLALWERVSVANVLSGALAAAAVLVLFRPARVVGTGGFRPVAAVRFAFYFLWKLIEASGVVAWEVLTPRNRINEGIVAVPVKGATDGLLTLVSNAISLTPGTLTLEVSRNPPVLYVHVLHLRSVERVRREIQHLDRLAIEAFGTEEAVAAARRLGVSDATEAMTPSQATSEKEEGE